MDFSVGDTLRVDGDIYNVIGKIEYRNINDNFCWFEYRLKTRGVSREKWLSFDMAFKEYSLCEVAYNVSTNGYHIVDEGEEEVIGVWGDVDVEVGDRARFEEYEDRTEEKIISKEFWDDGEELSVGYYLDFDEVSIYQDGFSGSSYGDGGFGSNYNSNFTSSNTSSRASKKGSGAWIPVLFIGFMIFATFISNGLSISSNSIEKYLKNSSYYTYETSITGNEKENADVYRSYLSDIDTVTKDIIDGIEGDTQSVQQNTEDGDNSVAILTKKEYCLVYQSEDGADILVQVSSRKYAYTTDKQPYRSRRSSYRYFRRYYYSQGYFGDSGSYSKYSSPYTSFDDSTVSSNSTDTYSSYSSSVRQASVNSRTSSGGGLSSGK